MVSGNYYTIDCKMFSITLCSSNDLYNQDVRDVVLRLIPSFMISQTLLRPLAVLEPHSIVTGG